MSRTLKNLAFTKIDHVTRSRETPPHRASCRRAVRVFLKRLSSLRRPTTKVANVPRNVRQLPVRGSGLLRVSATAIHGAGNDGGNQSRQALKRY
jgi:hypothetical protein